MVVVLERREHTTGPSTGVDEEDEVLHWSEESAARSRG